MSSGKDPDPPGGWEPRSGTGYLCSISTPKKSGRWKSQYLRLIGTFAWWHMSTETFWISVEKGDDQTQINEKGLKKTSR